ncbi:actin organization and endocytosis protein [Mortierella sp. AD094]|nr:actin organization and endocytosis protein [Mortierella sp. AD094]
MYNQFQQQQFQQQQQQQQYQQQLQHQQQQQQQYYQSAVGNNFQYNAGFGQSLIEQQQYGQMLMQQQQQQYQYQPARPGWAVSREEKAQYDRIFSAWDPDHSGFLSGERALEIFGSSGLPQNDLSHIWALADPNNQGKLNKDEFAVAMHLVYRKLNGGDIPAVLPDELIPPSTRDISETLDFVKKSLMTDIPSKAGSTHWGSYGSPASQPLSTSLSKRLSVRAPDDVGYVSSARRGNTSSSPVSSSRNYGSTETSIGRLQKQVSEQKLVLEATLSQSSDQSASSEDREILDLKAQIRNAQTRLLTSSNETIHRRLASGAEDLARLREERRNVDQELAALLRTISQLGSKVRDTDKSLEESRLELAKLKSSGTSSSDANIVGTGPGGAITADDRMKAKIALMKAQRMAALTGKPIPSAAQAGIDPDQAARIRAERDVNEQNVVEIESAVRRFEDTMRQLERDLDINSRPLGDSRSDNDRRKWNEGAGVQSEITRRFIEEIRPASVHIQRTASSYQSSPLSSSLSHSSISSQSRLNAISPIPSPSPVSSSPIASSSSTSSASLAGKTPEERRAIIRAQAEKRLRDRQNELLAKTHATRAEAVSPSPPPALPEVDAHTSAKFEEAERLAREKLLANAESKRRQAEQERQAERDLKARQERKIQKEQEDMERDQAEQDLRSQREAQELRDAAERKLKEEEELRRLEREREDQEERERKERFAQSTAAAKQQHQSTPIPAAEPTKREPIRITLDSNPFAKHRKSISSSDDDWDTASPVNSTPPAAAATVPSASAANSSNNPFFLMLSSNTAPKTSYNSHSKETSDSWDVVEKEVDVDLVDQLSQKLFSTPLPIAKTEVVPPSDVLLPSSNAPPPPPPPPLPVMAVHNMSSTLPPPPTLPTDILTPSSSAPVAPPPPPPTGIPVPPPPPSGSIPVPPPAPTALTSGSGLGSSTLPKAEGARGALLSQIQSGIRLKKALTTDKSSAKGIGRVLGEEVSSSTGSSDRDAATASHIASNSDQRPMGMPGLGGLFAGGIPTLKKSSGIATGRVDSSVEDHDSRRESTDWFGQLASHAPTDTILASPGAVPASVLSADNTRSQVQDQHHSELTAKVEESIESKIDFSSGYRAKALWSYSAMAPDQLSFESNDYLRAYPSKETGNVDWVYGISEKDEQVKGWLPKAYIQQVPEKFKAKALFAYTPQNEGELAIERGDIVDVLEKLDPQWWSAQNSLGVVGLLPATYLEEYIEGQAPVVELPIGKAKALYTYAGQTAEELSLEVEDEVEVMEKPDPLWWRVKNVQGHSGMVPSTYLKELDGQATSELSSESGSSEYESTDETPDDKADSTTESEDSDSDSESSDEDDELPVAPSSLTPTIAIAPVPRHRTPPPRPTGAYPKSKPLTSSPLSSSAPSKQSIMRKQSEGSLSIRLAVPQESNPGVRQRSGSHSEAMPKSVSHPRFASERTFDSTTPSAVAPSRSSSPLLLSSPSWSSSIGMGVSQSLPEKEKKRQEAIHELITTERVYLSYLYLVRDDFQRPLLDQGLINPAESQSIFMEWSSLLDLSQSIVDELAQRQANDKGVVLAVGDVINSHIVERAGCFMRYCGNHRDASVLLAKRMAESRLLLDFMTEAKSKPICRGLDISSFLLQPLQRITRYPLLIKKILEYTDEDHIDHLLLTEALVSAEQFLDRINESIRNGETKQRLEEIQRKLPAGEISEGLVLTAETKYLGRRQLLQEGHLRKAKSGRKLYAYLCNDLLLLFNPGRTQGSLTRAYSNPSLSSSSPSLTSLQSSGSDWVLYHAPIPLERVKVRADQSDDLKFSITFNTPVNPSITANHVPPHLQSSQQQIRQGSLQTVIHVKTTSAKERRTWVSAMDKAIEALAKAPRGYGMRTSIRPPLHETIGTMTIRTNEAIIPSREFGKSKSFQCSISLGEQLFTTRPTSTEHAFTVSFSILWRESVIFAVTDLSQVLEVKVMSSSPFSPDVYMGSTQVPFHTVVPYGERGTEVIASLESGIQVKFYMSYKAL